MGVRWVASGKRPRQTRLRHLFVLDDVKRMDAVAAEALCRFEELRARPDQQEEQKQLSYVWSSKRVFCKIWAYRQTLRFGHDRKKDPAAFERAYQAHLVVALDLYLGRVALCYLCGVVLTFEHRNRKGAKGIADPLVKSTNFSPDRRVHMDEYSSYHNHHFTTTLATLSRPT